MTNHTVNDFTTKITRYRYKILEDALKTFLCAHDMPEAKYENIRNNIKTTEEANGDIVYSFAHIPFLKIFSTTSSLFETDNSGKKRAIMVTELKYELLFTPKQ